MYLYIVHVLRCTSLLKMFIVFVLYIYAGKIRPVSLFLEFEVYPTHKCWKTFSEYHDIWCRAKRGTKSNGEGKV